MLEDTIEMLKQKARDSWDGQVGESRAQELETFLRKKLPEYAEALELTQEQVLEAIEGERSYSAINYYQEANFPSLEGVQLFETQQDLLDAMPSKQFRCPKCGGISTDPYKCNIGDECDWKAFGLFRTLGKGIRIAVKDMFLEVPRVDEIFMPLEMEEATDQPRKDGGNGTTDQQG